MKKLVTKLLCTALASSFILCGCNQVTETSATTESATQTEATTTTTVAETEPAPTEATPEINVDNMKKVADFFESKKAEGKEQIDLYADGIRGGGGYVVTDGVLVFTYASDKGESLFQVGIQSGKRIANVCYSITYKDKAISGVGEAPIENMEKFVDDVVADTASYVTVTDRSGFDGYSENFKKDLPIVYSRFIAMADKAFPELGLKLEDLGVNLGTKYRSVDPVQATSMETSVTNNLTYKNGVSTDGKKVWTEYFRNAISVMGGMNGKGWRSAYGQKSSTMLTTGDYVQYASTNKNNADLMYFKATQDKGEDESFFISVDNKSTKKKKSIAVSMTYRLNMKRFSIGKGVTATKYNYWVTINAKPGEYDKVFESRESLAKYAKVHLDVANKKGFGSNAWGKKANIDKLKKSFEADGCKYYTKEEVLDKLWEHHENFLASLDSGMVWMGTSLFDIGVNWKK